MLSICSASLVLVINNNCALQNSVLDALSKQITVDGVTVGTLSPGRELAT